jgi:hypothetical protein
MTTKNVVYRQGDVLMVRLGDGVTRPETDDEVTTDGIILAYGEVTGHAHRLSYSPGKARIKAFKTPTAVNDRLMTLDEVAKLLHEEHGEITLPAGDYIVRQQREYSPLNDRLVQD